MLCILQFPTNGYSAQPFYSETRICTECINTVFSAFDRGNTLKNIEKECNAKIMIRGKGSVKEGKVGRKDGQMLPGEDEPLHALVTANTMENVKKAVEQVCGEPRRRLRVGNLVMAPGTLTINCCYVLIDQKHPEAGY